MFSTKTSGLVVVLCLAIYLPAGLNAQESDDAAASASTDAEGVTEAADAEKTAEPDVE